MIESPISNTIIKPLTKKDFPKLLEFDDLATYQKNDTPPDHNPPPFTLEELTKMLDKGEIMGGIFDQEGKMIAYYNFEPKGDELYLDGIAVHPDYRNRGV